MRALTRLTRRQVAALVAAAVLGVAIVGAAAGWRSLALALALALALTGLGVVATLGSVVLVWRRLGEEIRAVRTQLERMHRQLERESRQAAGERHQDLVDRLEHVEYGQRRILAALEQERLAAADFRDAVLTGGAYPAASAGTEPAT
jgi:hypothetical protein